jgi:large subunit ribosomal protein L18
MKNRKEIRRQKIKMRIRKRISGTDERPRLSVFRSNKQIYAQVIDDLKGNTLVAASSMEKEIIGQKAPKTDIAKMVGSALAKKAIAAGIEYVVFDRNGYLYHGRVKALAEGAREAGLKF